MEYNWDSLECACGNNKFVQAVELRWKPGGGTTPKPTGNYICTRCSELGDIQEMINQKQLKMKRSELDDLQKRLVAEESPNQSKPGLYETE